MGIDNINSAWLEGIKGYSFVEESLKEKTVKVPERSFDSFFQAALDTLSETSRLEQEAQKVQLDFITGKTDDMLATIIAEQNAYVALNFTVQVTNKVIEAYRQIISMQL